MQRNMFTKSCVMVSKAELKRKCLSLHCLALGVITSGCAGWQRGYTTVGSDPSQAHTVSIPAEREHGEEKWRMSEAYRLWAHSASSEGAIMLCAIHHWTRTRAQPCDVAQGSWSGCRQPLLIKDTVCRWKELYQDDAVHCCPRMFHSTPKPTRDWHRGGNPPITPCGAGGEAAQL